MIIVVFPDGSDGKASACNTETRVQSLGWEDPLEKGMATHSSPLAWKSPCMEEPGGLRAMGSQRVGQLHFLFFHVQRVKSNFKSSHSTPNVIYLLKAVDLGIKFRDGNFVCHHV